MSRTFVTKRRRRATARLHPPGITPIAAPAGPAALVQRSAEETKRLCPKYYKYDTSQKIGDYNCAGLSFRAYK